MGARKTVHHIVCDENDRMRLSSSSSPFFGEIGVTVRPPRERSNIVRTERNICMTRISLSLPSPVWIEERGHWTTLRDIAATKSCAVRKLVITRDRQ